MGIVLAKRKQPDGNRLLSIFFIPRMESKPMISRNIPNSKHAKKTKQATTAQIDLSKKIFSAIEKEVLIKPLTGIDVLVALAITIENLKKSVEVRS